MENKYASEGIAEDIIRSFVNIACSELHEKTLLEKKQSIVENILDEDLEKILGEISAHKENIENLANIRRKTMKVLFDLYKDGDIEQWCNIKHQGMAMYTMFEAWQASDDNVELYTLYIEMNKVFISTMSKFLGITITDCASCFSDILKVEKEGKNEIMQ